MRSLTKDEVAQVRHILATAREDRATLAQLGMACDLAMEAGLADCAGELREHLRKKIGPERAVSGRPGAVGRDVVLGIVTGALTHHLLKGF